MSESGEPPLAARSRLSVMALTAASPLILLTADQCHRATRARDPRFDGVFFIGITTTGIYCRPICPTRIVISRELDRLAPTAVRVAEAGAARLTALGVAPRRALALAAAARASADGHLPLEPGNDIVAARRALAALPGVGDRLATKILLRTLCWPDAFPATDRALQRAAGVSGPGSLRARAERWRPWRAYGALHLWLQDMQR
jgi:hypothetical protein